MISSTCLAPADTRGRSSSESTDFTLSSVFFPRGLLFDELELLLDELELLPDELELQIAVKPLSSSISFLPCHFRAIPSLGLEVPSKKGFTDVSVGLGVGDEGQTMSRPMN